MHCFARNVLTYVICSYKGIHDCLVPITPYLAGIFKHLRSQGKLPPRVRAMDMRHVLLILLFLLHGLLFFFSIFGFHLHILHVYHIISYCVLFAYVQVQALLDTLQLLPSAKADGHLRIYSTLLIGHKKYPGEQRICCWPFKGRQLKVRIW